MGWKYKVTLRYEDGTTEQFEIEDKKEQASIEEARERADKEIDYVVDANHIP